MKNIFILICTHLFFICSGQENANYFVYKAYKIQKSEQVKSTKYDDLIKKNLDDIQFELKLNGTEAMFSPIEKIDNSQTMKFSFNSAFIKTQGEYYYDGSLKKVENKKPFSSKDYIVEYPFDYYKWEIDPTVVDVLGYGCKKAVFTRTELGLKTDKIYKITVWYDDRFTNNVAPFGLVGLPGLIVQVNFNDNYMVALSSFEKKKREFKIQPFRKGKRVPIEEFQALIDETILEFRRMNAPSPD